VLNDPARDNAAGLEKAWCRGENIDYSDGLEAEHEQGITVNVAYRYFSTASRQATSNCSSRSPSRSCGQRGN
jgi:sulfate adenylyltransferase subunit 1 (EFTu-like GTPase family)